MSLPPWISQQLENNRKLNTKLTQQHVVEKMHDADRPIFSLQQIQQRVKPDVSKVTVRNRLDDLEERGIVATETYSDSLTLYYINHPESNWPLSPEGKHALQQDFESSQNPLFEFLRHPQVQQIFREELWRSVAWAGLSLFGWAILISSSELLPATVWTVGALPVLTWASLTVGMIGIRLATGTEFQIQTTEGLDLITVGVAVLGGFWAAFLIFVLDWSPLISIGLYIAVMAAYLVCYIRVVRPELSSPGED